MLIDLAGRRHSSARFAILKGLSVSSQGGSQALENGDTFVGWGVVGRFSEFDADGHLIFDASVPAGYDTYRAYRFSPRGDP